MIRKIDWYIIKKYVSTTIFMVLILSVIAMVIDASEKTDDFVKTGLSSFMILKLYYVAFVPWIISMIFPLMTFIAVIYFTSKMSERSEIVAIIAAGVPFNRLLRPYMMGALFMGALFWGASQYLIPKANILKGNFQAKYIDSKSTYEINQYYGTSNYIYLRIDNNTYAGLRNYDTASKSATSGFFLYKVKGNKIYYHLKADYLRWDTAKKNWRVENALERTMDGEKETLKQVLSMNITLNNIKPREIRPDKYLKEKMTTPELSSFIAAEERRGTEGLNDYRVERYKRDATPFSLFILTLIGAVIASRKNRGGSGLHLAFGIILAAMYVVMDKFSLTFSTKSNLHPMLAAWMPNLIFSIVAVWVYIRAPK